MTSRLTRSSVIEHAALLVDDIGLHELTITKLGRSLGIAPPGVYRHADNIADLHRRIARRAAREVATELAIACAGLAGAAALSALAHRLREWAAQCPGQYAALQVAPDPSDPQGQEAARALLIVIGTALRAYHLDGDDETDAIRLIRSSLHGFIALEHSGGFKSERSLDATFARIVSSLDATLLGWAPK